MEEFRKFLFMLKCYAKFLPPSLTADQQYKDIMRDVNEDFLENGDLSYKQMKAKYNSLYWMLKVRQQFPTE